MKKRLEALTGLRFFAAMAVVLYHFATPHLVSWPQWIQNLVASGFVGVSLFFMLSGFILAYNYLGAGSDSRIPALPFWKARFARVYPVYALSLAISLPAFLLKVDWMRGSARAFGDVVGMTTLVTTLTQAWFPMQACRWNCPSWSLSVEAFFYALFPVIGIWIARMRTRDLWLLSGLAFLLSLAAPTLYEIADPHSLAGAHANVHGYWLRTVRWHPLAHLPIFAMGIALGCLFLRRERGERTFLPVGSAPAVVGGVVVLLVLANVTWFPHTLVHNGLLAPAFFLLIVGLSEGDGLLHRALSHRWLVSLGEASYSIYILHMPIEGWLRFVAMRLGVYAEDSWPFLMVNLAVLVLSSLLAHRYVEIPARKALRARWGSASVPPALSAAA